MENFTKDELKLIAEKRGIKIYQNMSRKKLISALDKTKRNFKDIALKKLDQIAKMQNLSQDKFEQIARMNNLPRNKLEQMAKERGIKEYTNTSKEGLLISLLKSGQSIDELCQSNYNNAEIKEIKEKFNALRNKFSKKEIEEIRKIFYNFKKLEQKDGLTKQEERKKVEESLKKTKENINRLERYRYHNNDDLDCKGIRQIENLFNEINEDYYKLIKTKAAFNNNYIEYQSKGDKDKRLSVKEYLYMIMPYLEKMINNRKTTITDFNDLLGLWKIQLTTQINFISSSDTNEFRTMHTKSDNIEILMGTETNDIINELFESFLRKYQEGLETKMKGSEFVFEIVNLLYYSLHKITLKRGGSYIKSSEWLRNERATINSKSTDNKCFRDAITAALNYNKIPNHPERISNVMPFFFYFFFDNKLCYSFFQSK